MGEHARDRKKESMAKRILMVITPETIGDLRSAARSAAGVARDSGGQVRMVRSSRWFASAGSRQSSASRPRPSAPT
jgi:hypothetical protein